MIQEEFVTNLKKLADERKTSPGCLHKACRECKGTGIRSNGGPCVHGISCPCDNCSFR